MVVCYLPRGAVPLVRARERAAIPAAALLGTFLFWTAAYGNVQPLVVAVLVWLVPTRAGPAAIGLAASLKAFPILFSAVCFRRRDFGAAAIAVVVAAALTAPVLAFNLSHYPLEPGQALLGGPLWLQVVLAATALGGLVRDSPRRAWLWSGLAVVLAYPRMHLYDTTFLFTGADRQSPPNRENR